MQIFITGAAGFLGSFVAERMLSLGHKVIGVDNLVGGLRSNVPEGVIFYEADCDDLIQMCRYMEGCDVVFHAACTAHDGFSVFSPYYITKNTFQITMSVLSAAISNHVQKFYYCSSMSRYGKQAVLPYTENMVCNPVVPYGAAKYASEMVIRQLCGLNDIYYNIFVPHNIIGPRQCQTDPFRNVAAIMINRMLQGKQPIIYGDGCQKRSFSYIDDVVTCIENAILLDSFNGEIFNVGPDEEFITINELASVIAGYLDFPLDPIYVSSRPQEIKYAYCSADKARRLLNYSTKTPLREALRKMTAYYKKIGPRDFSYHYNLEIINDHTPKTWTDHLI